MRTMGPLIKGIESVLMPPDTVGTAILTTAGAVVAQGWPTGAHIVHLNSSVRVYFNPASTSATVPTTNSAGSTVAAGQNIMLNTVHQHYYYIGSSTGYSIAGETSGVATLSFWKEGG